MNRTWTRRQFLGTTAAAAGVVAQPFWLRGALAAEPDVVIELTAQPGAARLWRGTETRVLRYGARVLRGPAGAVRPSSGAIGPTLELRRGERVRIRFLNRLDAPSIVHWHGMLVPEHADGHPRFAVGPGGEYVYEFTVRNPAGTYLYHPHPHGVTGAQVYYGLSGLLIVREPDEPSRGLPGPAHELALVIQDRHVDADNQLVFKRSMMDGMTGVLGDTVLVNGVPDAAFNVAPRAYRLRLANVSNARIYKLAWSDGRPMQVIASDNGLLSSAEGPMELPHLTLAPFERVELLEDFGARRPGTELALESREFSSLSMNGTMRGMMGGMMGQGMMSGMMGDGMTGADQGRRLLVARFAVGLGPRVAGPLLRLPEPGPLPEMSGAELHTQLSFRMMRGFLNGRSFEMTRVAGDERLPLGHPSLWTFRNDGPGMAMPHPMHVHGVRFRIVERRGGVAADDLREGIVSVGFKDTFLALPGETVRIGLTPDEAGMFMVHCHNLEH